MKNRSEIEVEISCIENEIVQTKRAQPSTVTPAWLESKDSAIRALKWVLDHESAPVDYRDYYGRFGDPV